MRMMPPIAVTLALAACGSPDAAANNAGVAVPGASPQEAAAPTGVDASPQAVPATMPTPTPIASLPAAFTGRWGMVPNDCDPTRADAKGLMTISADGLKFYESRATVGDLRQVTATSVQATLAYHGEGQSWRKATTLALHDGGRTLIRTESDPGSSDTYSKCPA